jgi:lysophospholipase L1-like esterase
MKVAVGLLVLASLLAGSSTAAPPAELRVLFVGNSLTETNDLPARVAALARATGRKLEYQTITFGGFNLEDHWNKGDARTALATRRWDMVVMQQGPSALPESQADLRRWATRWADEARAAGTRPALLTVWPESYRRSALREVIASYRRAAQAAHAELLPAGLAWEWTWFCDRRIPLYGADGFHPSALGTQTAALVVYGRLFKAPVVGVPMPFPRRTSRLVQKAAARALDRPVTRLCR